MEIILVGVNHKTAPVETRERLAVLESHVPAALASLRSNGVVRECAVLSTCNRTELYGLGESASHVAEHIVDVLSSRHDIPREHLRELLYHRFNDDAARHLFSVASGLDSLIVGEGQILAQVREAHRVANEHGAAGSVLNRLFERAIRTGKRARTETRIAQGAPTVSAAAVALARKVHGDLADKSVLVIGTGKVGLLTVKLLIEAGVAKIGILSRTLERAQKACERFSGVAARPAVMDAIADHLAEADVVVSCTGSPVAVVTRATVASILRRRRYRPLFIVDIAVPRDVESSVNDLENVYLYNVDDLSGVVAGNLAERRAEIDGARAIVEDEVVSFSRYLASLETVPAIRRLRENFEQRRQRELQALGAISDDERARLDAFSRALVNRLLHHPTVRIKALAESRDVREGITFLMDLFESAPEDAPTERQPETVSADEEGARG